MLPPFLAQKPLANVVRASLLLGSWAACMYEPSFDERDDPGTSSSIGGCGQQLRHLLLLRPCATSLRLE